MKLVSAEGAEFWVDRKCAMVSGTIKAMLSGGYCHFSMKFFVAFVPLTLASSVNYGINSVHECT